MKESIEKFIRGKVVGGTVTVVGFVASIVCIVTFVIPLWARGLDGNWTLETQIADPGSRNKELRYAVNLTCDGTHVTGKGYKVGESAGAKYTPCKGKACTSIDIEGSVDMDDDSLEAVFTEEGEQGTTHGQLELEEKGKSWAGTFDSDGATSSGTASLSRPDPLIFRLLSTQNR